MAETKTAKLFTPGPLEVPLVTKQTMLRDVGSRDDVFISAIKNIRRKLVQLAGVSSEDYACVPMQGSGSFALEATLTTVIPRQGGKLLLLDNGWFAKRQAKICDVLQIPYHVECFAENERISIQKVKEVLLRDPSYTNIGMVHCETRVGVLNPVEAIGTLVRQICPNASFHVDAISTLGGLPVNMKQCNIDFLISSANKCIEGVPGIAFVIAKREKLIACEGFARSFCLDLVEQHQVLERTGQFRTTPPTHVMLALEEALAQLEIEGGVMSRFQRYQRNNDILHQGMRKLGFITVVPKGHDCPVCSSFLIPTDPNFEFREFYTALKKRGCIIPASKNVASGREIFVVSAIGHLFPSDVRSFLRAVREVIREMNIKVPVVNKDGSESLEVSSMIELQA